MNIVKVLDIAEGKASIEDVEFGWRMFMVNHFGNGKPLAVVFAPLNLEYPEADICVKLSEDKANWTRIKDKVKVIYPSIEDLGKAKLKAKKYDMFVLYNHVDEVGNLSNAKKYFKNHHVSDVDADKLFDEAVERGDIPEDQAERLRK